MDPVEICSKNNPKKVFDYQNVHYFYWPVELGLSHIDIKKFKIPVFPIKFFDYEPITTKDAKIVLTRFHYRILVYFNNLRLSDNKKPVVDFSFGSHSPLAHVDLSNSQLGCSKPFGKVDSKEIDIFMLLFALYEKILEGKIKIEPCAIKSYQTENSEVEQKYLFDPKLMVGLITLGSYPDRKDLEEIGYNLP